MATINLTPLIDNLGGNSATGATGTATAVAMYSGTPSTRISGTGVILPVPVELSFTNGVLSEPLVLDVLPTGNYWKFTIQVGDVKHIYNFTIPSSGTYDFDELTFIDPVTYTSFAPAYLGEVEYTVTGGTEGTQPTFSGSPLFEGRYVRNGDMVLFDVQVDMDNITGFGTGQFYVSLPFPSKYPVDFRNGCLHDASTGYQYHISGHVAAQSNELMLFTTDTQGNNLRDYEFTSSEPITLATADNFHISGTYILEEGN
jgi:hypothetical protein